MIEFKQYNQISIKYISEKITSFLIEDIPDGDKTTNSILSNNTYISATIEAVENLVFAGQKIIPFCFGENCNVIVKKTDGNLLYEGDCIGIVRGSAKDILSRERIMLNIIQRLCGIATMSYKFATIAKPFNVKILDTRKTTPGLRDFEKYAVKVGGCYNHRSNLSDGILIKDNHIIAAGSISKAVELARKHSKNIPIELEVDTLDQVREGLSIKINRLLLDNMSSQHVREAVSVIRNSKNGDAVFIEVSGGINFDNINSFLDTGINAISIGALTHSAISKDIRLVVSR